MDPRAGAQIHDDPREPEDVVSAAMSPGASTCWPRRGRSVEAVTATVSRPLPVVSAGTVEEERGPGSSSTGGGGGGAFLWRTFFPSPVVLGAS